jgi:hypothetical protein
MHRYNHKRGVVLIGHSQGAGLLQQLVRGKIDPYKPARQRLISAMLLGGNVLVKKDGTAGGVFNHVLPCRNARQSGCVVAYSTYDEPPPNDTKFGLPGGTFADTFGLAGRTDLEVLCTNPAALAGGSAPLRTLLPTTPFPGAIGGGVKVTFGGAPPTAPTPWVEPRDHYSGACVHESNGASVLKISRIGAARDLIPVPDATWGLHLADVNIALGDLVNLAGTQSKAYSKRRAKQRAKLRAQKKRR